MGEAGKEHQALLLHCAVEVAGDADIFATDAQPAALTLSAADLQGKLHTDPNLYSRHACKTLVKVQAWCDRKGLDTVIHPIPECFMFLEDLLSDVVAKKSKDPFGTIRVARKALSKIRYVS